MDYEKAIQEQEKRIRELEQTNVKQSESLKSAHKRIEENAALTKKIYDLTAAVQNLAYQLQAQNEQIKKMVASFDERMQKQGERIGTLEKKPGKKWDKAVEKVIFTALGILVLYVFTRLGM